MQNKQGNKKLINFKEKIVLEAFLHLLITFNHLDNNSSIHIINL